MKSTSPVWDRPVRLLHWGLVLAVVAAWWTGSTSLPHEILGYACGAIIVARLVWGFAGSRYARFSQFLRGPRATARYAAATIAGTAPRYLGHNPLGAWMVMAFFATLAALVLTGWLYNTDMFWGYAWLANLHAVLGWLLVALAAVHLAGVVATGRKHRENLVAAMFTGHKRAAAPGDVE